MKRIFMAFQFLTIIPIRDMGDVSEKDVGSTSAFFPIVGIFEGAILLAIAVLFLKVFPAELTSGFLVLAMIVINGGLHLDGIADTFDAIASRAGREKKLAIMKDSTVGPFGVMTIVMVLLLKYLLLNALFFNSKIEFFYAGVFMMPVMSRWALVPAILHSRSARKDGLGKMFIEHTGKKEFVIATVLTLIAAGVSYGVNSHLPLFAFYLMVIMPVLYMLGFSIVWFAKKNFGGMTGDTFGAVYEISVLMFLIMRVIWSQKFIL